MLTMYNKIKSYEHFCQGKGELTDLDSDCRYILVSPFRTILMKMIYKDESIDGRMSDSNIGARKKKNIRNNIFVVNSIIHYILSKKS